MTTRQPLTEAEKTYLAERRAAGATYPEHRPRLRAVRLKRFASMRGGNATNKFLGLAGVRRGGFSAPIRPSWSSARWRSSEAHPHWGPPM